MDLIDRQALLKDIEKYHLSDGKFQHWVEVQQSVEAEPVRHGHWGSKNECSECGCQPWFERDIHFLHYCPNCGAKMDEVEQDG